MAAMQTPNPSRILIADDDRALCGLLAEYLRREGFVVDLAHDGAEALLRLRNPAERPDLLILDVMMPGRDGLDTLRELRMQHRLPVIMLSARGEPVDRVIGLELGADDYLAKPCLPRELLARVRAQLRRNAPLAAGTVQVGNLQLFPGERRAQAGEQELTLTGAEFLLLLGLAQRAGELVDKAALTRRRWGASWSVSTAASMCMSAGYGTNWPRLRRRRRGSSRCAAPATCWWWPRHESAEDFAVLAVAGLVLRGQPAGAVPGRSVRTAFHRIHHHGRDQLDGVGAGRRPGVRTWRSRCADRVCGAAARARGRGDPVRSRRAARPHPPARRDGFDAGGMAVVGAKHRAAAAPRFLCRLPAGHRRRRACAPVAGDEPLACALASADAREDLPGRPVAAVPAVHRRGRLVGGAQRGAPGRGAAPRHPAHGRRRVVDPGRAAGRAGA